MRVIKEIEVDFTKEGDGAPFNSFVLHSLTGTHEVYEMNNAVRYLADVMVHRDRKIYYGNYVYNREDGTIGYKPAALKVMNDDGDRGVFRIYELDL